MPKPSQAIIPVREWWLTTARDLIAKDGRTLTRLGEDLARHIPGKRKFEHAQLSRFKNGDVGATFELVIALCEEFEALSQPIFFARSHAEAVELSGVARKYDPPRERVATSEARPPSRLAEIVSIESRQGKRRPANDAQISSVAKRRAR